MRIGKILNKLLLLFILSISPNDVFADTPSLENIENIIIEIPQETITIPKTDIDSWFIRTPVLLYDHNYASQIENIEYCPDAKIICTLTQTERLKHTLQKKEISTLNKKAILLFLEDISRKYNTDPVNATFTVADNKVSNFSLSKNGLKLNTEKSLREIVDFFSKIKTNNSKIKLSFEIISPDIQTNDAEKLGIKSLIGEGKSNFSGSTLSRIHNIKVATGRFDGLLIKPGEEFSFVKNLGEVDGEHGYKQELVIKQGITEPEFGGGICQVSTTAFRAAIYSGLEITAREIHAYPVHSYNPQGLDSTVYLPNPDLRFKNNTPAYILIKTDLNIEKKELIFKFYGTSDGRKVEVEGPRTISRQPDGAMKTTFKQKVIDASGNIFIDTDFNSSYNSPDKYPHPGEKLTSKPKNWSNKEWQEYKKDNKL
jgi:vancomycin resistance protein YoaR